MATYFPAGFGTAVNLGTLLATPKISKGVIFDYTENENKDYAD
jgi:hypothetical protein